MRPVYNDVVRPSREKVDALRQVLREEFSPSCLAADAGPRIGAVGGLLAVNRSHVAIGPALTVDLPERDLVDILPILPTAQPGDIVVLACHGNNRMAMWGGVMATFAQMAGIGGAVVDGAVRDVDELRELDFPLWYRAAMPRRCPPAAAPGAEQRVQVNIPVVINGEQIRPGDIVVADENGVAVVPPDLIDDVVRSTRELLAKEHAIRERIKDGAGLSQLLTDFGFL